MDKPKNAPPIPDTVVKRVENLLLDGEELLFVTQPHPWRMLSRVVVYPLSGFPGFVILATLTINMTRSFLDDTVIRKMSGLSSLLTGSLIIMLGVFALACLLLTFMPLWSIHNIKRYIYVLTDKRAIIIEPTLFLDDIKSYGRREITQLRIQTWREGFDDLLFGLPLGTGFLGIPEAEAVRKLMLETFEFDEHDFWKE